ncbi:MAG: hypothetical protein IPH36_19635 [Saprospiraceae bacterium]|nr:hypothetical protein [Saprospiraceae bacterium]
MVWPISKRVKDPGGRGRFGGLHPSKHDLFQGIVSAIDIRSAERLRIKDDVFVTGFILSGPFNSMYAASRPGYAIALPLFCRLKVVVF